jgi:hypothetical protein
MGDAAVRCTICGIKQNGAAATKPAADSAHRGCSCGGAAGAGQTDTGFFPNLEGKAGDRRLADINIRLNREKSPRAVIAPYIPSEINKFVPSGPVYTCRNCGTINSVDDAYCVICGLKVPDVDVSTALKRAESGEPEFVAEPPVKEATPYFGEATGFSTSLNTLEAALKPYVYNYTINGDNNIVNNGVAVPYAAAERQDEQPAAVFAEEAPQAVEPPPQGLTQEEIERQRRAVEKAYKKNIKQQVKIKRRGLSFLSLVVTALIFATFFIQYIPYTQKHDVLNDERMPQESIGADIIASALMILHLDDTYDAVVDAAAKVGISLNAAYYGDVVMEVESYGYWQTWVAHSLPFTLAAALIAVILNLILFFVKLATGNLKRKFYLVSLLQFVLLAFAAIEVLIMTKLQSDVFFYEIGYGLIFAVVLALAVIGVQRFFGKQYAMNERERVRSLYGY